jgi:aspartate-semialdehyde dehydrogenase
MMTSGVKVAVVEPTGVTGSEIVKILDERNFPVRELVLLGKSRSVGEKVKFQERGYPGEKAG